MSHLHRLKNPAQVVLILSIAMGFSQSALAEAPNQKRYTISAITSHSSISVPSGTLQMWANSINNLGQIVGGEIRQNSNGENYVAAYQMHNSQITYLDFGSVNSDARDINDAGQIIGGTWGVGSGSSDRKSVLFNNGTTTVLSGTNLSSRPLGEIYATDINNRGDIVATQYYSYVYWDGSTGETYQARGAFPLLFKNGVATALPNPFHQSPYAYAVGINDNGDFLGAGLESDYTNAQLGYMIVDGSMSTISPNGYSSYSVMPQDINNQGQVVGQADFWSTGGMANSAFFYDKGLATNLRTFDGIIDDSDRDASAALAINDKGQIVGYSNSPAHDGSKAAFLYEDGTMINLNDYLKPELDWQLTRATDINELGQIIGVGFKNGVLTSYLLTPTELTQVPLPASAWLFVSGLAAIIAARRKQKNLNNSSPTAIC